MKTGLKALISPHSTSEFIDLYEKNQPFVVHGLKDETRPLMELPILQSLDGLLSMWPSSIQVHLPDARDEISSIDTTSQEARRYFDEGMGLLFNDAQHLSPLLQEWLIQIRRELKISAMTYGRCLIYATPDGKGTAPHFDQNINFVLQIHGTKIWTMAPNEHVQNPLSRHTMGQPVDPELMSYLERAMPESMPAKTQSFVLRPGSLLFVPRGYWHSTEAEGDALALNFTFTAPTWIDLFSAALRSRLAFSPEWRETAHQMDEAKFDHLLSILIGDMPNWRAEDILAVTESEE